MITHVAIRFQGKVWSLLAPNRHHDVIRYIVEQTGVSTVDAREDDQGFLIDGDQYCRRKLHDGVWVQRPAGEVRRM